MPVTERVILSLQAGLGVDGWKDALKTLLQVLKTQEGYIRTRWGPWSEDENKLELFIGWENVDAQKKFEASADFQASMVTLKPLLAAKPLVYFIEFSPYAPKEVIDSQFVELITLEKGLTGSEADAKKAIEAIASHAGCNGVTSGISTEEVNGHKVFVGIAGWDSVEASKAATKSLSIGETEIHHVNFRFPVKGFRGL
ncbi:hypothetical protein BP5796_11174 [Coleophoma crateriformis]|uniref:ABM domain-containing protein n=1 Tax=Coleophoma crateriformis TaxID=565419 RepID=A0A3D8QM50_9HELO|nr:hypothetical protein BP5796_11174 [Coleophoma crateriformis]